MWLGSLLPHTISRYLARAHGCVYIRTAFIGTYTKTWTAVANWIKFSHAQGPMQWQLIADIRIKLPRH